jgi:hypothetical protein
MPRWVSVLGCLALLSHGSSCGRNELAGPPEMRLGREECAECGMLVQEDRCSAAMLVDRDRETLFVFFDDLGCLIDYEYGHQEDVRVLERWVRDYERREWLRGEHAVFVRAARDDLRTPMGTGWVAVADGNGASRLGKRWEAGPMDYRGAYRDRREWMWANYGKPDGARPAELP